LFTVGGAHKRGRGTPQMVPGTISFWAIHIFQVWAMILAKKNGTQNRSWTVPLNHQIAILFYRTKLIWYPKHFRDYILRLYFSVWRIIFHDESRESRPFVRFCFVDDLGAGNFNAPVCVCDAVPPCGDAVGELAPGARDTGLQQQPLVVTPQRHLPNWASDVFNWNAVLAGGTSVSRLTDIAVWRSPGVPICWLQNQHYEYN